MTSFVVPPSVTSAITSLFSKNKLPKIFDMLSYNVIGGKLTRYSMFSHIYENGDADSMALIGFCLEVFHASFLMSDDIVDKSSERRGKPCFYFKRKMMTLRDSKFLISLIYKLLSDNPCKSVFEKSFFDTCLGQVVDTKTKERAEYTFKLYKTICELKTSSYSVYLPLACGYKMANKPIPAYLEDLSNLVGLIYQMNDDYLNFFPEKQKKTSNDLEEYKLTYFTAKLNEENPKWKELDIFFNKQGVPDFVKMWVISYFHQYMEDKKKLVDMSREMIKKEDERDLLFLYDILKRYELN